MILKIYKKIFFLLILCLCFSKNIFPQINDTLTFPKADIHLGISGIKGGYLGTIYQISNNLSFETSYGRNIFPSDPLETLCFGINYHFHYFILNCSYVHFERIFYFSHIISINIELFSIDKPGFHWIGAIGGFYELGKYFNNDPKKAGVNFNLALGFTII